LAQTEHNSPHRFPQASPATMAVATGRFGAGRTAAAGTTVRRLGVCLGMVAALCAWAEGPLSFVHSSAGSVSRHVSRSPELVVMRAAKKKKVTKKKSEAASTDSSGEAIQSGDEVILISRTGCYINAEEKSEDIKARAKILAPRAKMIIENEVDKGPIKHGDRVYIKGFNGGYFDIQGDRARIKMADKSRCNGLEIWKKQGSGQGEVFSGDSIFLKGGDRGTYIDVEEQNVQARWPDEGKWQEMNIEFWRD